MTDRVQEERRWTVWICPECGHWSGSSYLRPDEGNPGWRPRCKMKDNGCSRPLMDPAQVASASSLSQALAERDRLAEVAKELAAALKAYTVSDPSWGLRKAAEALSSYEALKEEAKAE